MIQYKKIILTLVALIAVTTGAWAESKPIGLNVEYAVGDVITSTTDVYVYYGVHPTNSKQMAVKITSTQPLKISMIDAHSFGFNGNDAVYFLPDGVATEGSAGVIPCVGESTGDATVVHVASGSGTLTDPYVFGSGPSGTPVPITWDATAKTATIAAMPAGNVTVNVKYFAQAEFAKSIGETPELLAPTAINDVPATTDGAIVKAGTVANIGESEVKQGTLMYFVSQSTGNTAPTYDTEGWSEDVPTANGLAQGKAYVWYYIKGAEPAQVTDRTDDNTRSDSDIMPLGTDGFVTIAAEPTYAVTFADGTPETDKWTASPNADVTKGQTVTVTYTGTKKVIGVKAEKKAKAPAAEGHALSASVVGDIVGTDGNVYAVADKDNLPEGVTAVAMVAYKSETTGSSLAIALADEGSMQWYAAKSTCEGKSAIGGHSWKLPSQTEWKQMFSANGGNENSYTGLNTALATAGGDSSKLQMNGKYWSSTPDFDDFVYRVYLEGVSASWNSVDYEYEHRVRACLAF